MLWWLVVIPEGFCRGSAVIKKKNNSLFYKTKPPGTVKTPRGFLKRGHSGKFLSRICCFLFLSNGRSWTTTFQDDGNY